MMDGATMEFVTVLEIGLALPAIKVYYPSNTAELFIFPFVKGLKI